MFLEDAILKNARVISPAGSIDCVSDVRIKNGRIAELGSGLCEAGAIIDLGGKILAPAFVEMHCHLREPGFEEKETIETGIQSAISGGYAAICPMANTNPVNDNPETLKSILNKAQNIGLYPVCAVTKNLEGKDINDLESLKTAGAVAFSDDGKPIEDMSVLFLAMKIAKDLDFLLISHAEDASIRDAHKVSESIAVARELELLREVNCRYHFAHISTKRSVELIRQAKADGVNVTCETAPHYLSLTASDIKDNSPTFKMNPPLRSDEDVLAIVKGLQDGTIDAIATDHAPHTTLEKQRPWELAPMGIVGFETAFGVCNTYLVKTGCLSLKELIGKLSFTPARILRVPYGEIAVGQEANLAIIDENLVWTVKAGEFKSKCKISPFEGKTLSGKVIKTIVKGEIYDNI